VKIIKMAAKKNMSFWSKLKGDFSTIAIVMIPIAIAINQVGRLISTSLELPLFLDTIGTVLTAMLCGPWVAATGGFLTNVVTALIYGRPTSVAFGLVQLAIGFIAGLFIYKKWVRKWWQVFIFGVTIAIVAALMSAIISSALTAGLSGTGVDLVIAFFLNAGAGFWTSIISARILVEMVDKIVTAFVAWIPVKSLPQRYAKLFKYVKNVK